MVAWSRRQIIHLVSATASGLMVSQLPQWQAKANSSAKVAIVTWIGYTALYIAREKGFFQELGLNLETIVFGGGAEADAAFLAERVDANTPVISNLPVYVDQGKEFQLVLVYNLSYGADGILARNRIVDIAAFKGERIGVEIQGVSHFFLLQVLKEVGLTEADVILVDITPDAAATAYQTGSIDIAVTYEPFLSTAAAAQADGRIIYDSRQMPTAIADTYIFDKAFAEANPSIVENFIRGHFMGLEYLKSNPEEGLAIAARELELSPDELADQLEGLKMVDATEAVKILADPTDNLYIMPTINSLAEFLYAQGQISSIPDMTPYIEPKYLIAAVS
jgi:NitT/TauT family transport system substrate-binding protein